MARDLEELQRADHDVLTRVEAKIDSFISGQADHETRIRLLEGDGDRLAGTVKGLRWSIAAMGAVIGLIEPFIIVIFQQYISKH